MRAKGSNIMIVIMIMLPFLQILQVGLMIVGLFFEANVMISLLCIPIFQVKEQPLYSIPKEEGEIEQFFLLASMNAFVIILNGIKRLDHKSRYE